MPYGSELHLLRYLGRHRRQFERRVREATGGDVLDWLDHPWKDNKTAETDCLPTNTDELRKFLKRAEGGDTTTLPALRKALRDPAFVDQCGGDLARQMERSLINTAAGNNLVFKEALIRKVELLRAELCGPKPTPLERLLVERIVTCWLHLHDAQLRFVQADSMPLPRADYLQRAIDRYHRRYLSAVKMLATVRRLALPVLFAQVNVAQNQADRAASPVGLIAADQR